MGYLEILKYSKLYYLKKQYDSMEFYNSMSPFPVYDTEILRSLKQKIRKMKINKKVDYDNLPVYFCKHCKSLHIEVDENNHDICGRCGAVDEIDTLPNIKAYSNKYRNIWE